jgi:hypothetical protein
VGRGGPRGGALLQRGLERAARGVAELEVAVDDGLVVLLLRLGVVQPASPAVRTTSLKLRWRTRASSPRLAPRRQPVREQLVARRGPEPAPPTRGRAVRWRTPARRRRRAPSGRRRTSAAVVGGGAARGPGGLVVEEGHGHGAVFQWKNTDGGRRNRCRIDSVGVVHGGG